MSLADIPHGTYSGYQKEKRLRLKPCDECREANRIYHQGYRADPTARRREQEQKRIREVASALIVRRHYDEYRDLVAELTEQGEQLRHPA